jgi:hypothetical protein
MPNINSAAREAQSFVDCCLELEQSQALILLESGDGCIQLEDAACPEATVSGITSNSICDRTGFKLPRYDPLVRDGYGWMVRTESKEDRHPGENIRPRIEKSAKGPSRQEPVGDERFIDDEFPSGVNKTTDLDP